MAISRSIKSIAKCLEELGYKEFTDFQKKAIKTLTLLPRSLILVAPTGTGKTEAAIIPVLYHIWKRGLKPISALYITPLRALNRDIERRIVKLAECFGVSVELRHGDTPYNLRKKIEQNPPHILVTTPESLNYLIVNPTIMRYLYNLEFIVIDEFRELIESKRGLLLFTVIHLLEELILGKNLVKIALTATLKNEEYAKSILGRTGAFTVEVLRDTNSKKVDIDVLVPKVHDEDRMVLEAINVDSRLLARLKAIIEYLKKYRGVLIFTNTRSLAERLGFLLKSIIEKLGINIEISVHHGSLSRSHRLKTEEDFKKGIIRGLVATSSMELGIDIGHVDYVIQYMSPRQATRLLQRIGRSGHKLGGISRGAIISNNNSLQILESVVLARRALAYDIEDEKPYNSPLDVLAYAIAVLSMVLKRVNKYQLYATLVKHVLYEKLDYNTFNALLDYLSYARIVRVEGDYIVPTRKTRLYVYKTTMIPKSRDILVIETSSGKKVGVLNEEYVVLNISESDTIVLGGKTWRVIGYDPREAKLYVEPVHQVSEAIIPHWEGENIPVEYRVAREVGSIIRRIKEQVPVKHYGKFIQLINSINEKLLELGDDKNIVIDFCYETRLLTINVFGGSKVNRFIKDLIQTVITSRYPFIKVHGYSTPYAIFIQFDEHNVETYVDNILEVVLVTLKNLDKYLSRDVIKVIAKSYGPLYWRIYQVAQRFGAIDPDSGTVSRSILEGFVDTVIGIEALNEVINRDYDIESLADLSSKISKGSVRIINRKSFKFTDFHRELLGYIEIPQIGVVSYDLDEYRERLLNRKISLVCINCGYIEEGRVRDYIGVKEYRCPKCGLKTLAPIKSNKNVVDIIIKRNKGVKLSKSERSLLEDLRKRAVLLLDHGERAIIALAGLGVGVSEAARIVSKTFTGSIDDLVREVYEVEKRFLRVKRYID
ncbi:MAG: DEAD/DEAH box helicase [Thermoprotei archaeon]